MRLFYGLSLASLLAGLWWGESLGAEVRQSGAQLVLKAGILEQTIDLAGNGVQTLRLTADGQDLLAGITYPTNRNFSFEVCRANPDRRPRGLRPGEAAGSPIQFREAARLVGGAAMEDRRPDAVRWEEPTYIDGVRVNAFAGAVSHEVGHPNPNVTRLTIRIPLVKPDMLKGLEIALRYEIYDDYPAVRKWIEISNRGGHWLRIRRLLIEDLELAVAFNNPVPLTPGAVDTEPCMVGFSSFEGRCGVIAASEVPSGLRRIAPSGSMGYTPELFEWVLGPSETFVSEPAFYFGFSGDVRRTVSAISTPLDRAVEGPLQRFLDRHVVLPSHTLRLIAPQWLTFASFGRNVNDAMVRKQAKIAARAGFKQVLIDAGWQVDLRGTEIDTRRFPDFAATAKYVQSLGLSLGLWVSDYRYDQSKDLRQMPDACLEPRAIMPPLAKEAAKPDRPLLAMSFASPWRDYYARDLVGLYRQYGVDYFKQDLTALVFGDLAEGHESRTRKESLLRSLRGLLAAQDAIRQQTPQIITELTHEIYWGNPGPSCDLAVLKHAAQYHTPHNACTGTLPPRGKGSVRWTANQHRQRLLSGCNEVRLRFYAHRGLPLFRVEYYAIATQNYQGSLTPQVQDRQIASMFMGAPLTFSGDLEWLTDENVAHYRKRFDLLARLQKTYDVYRHFQFSGVPAPTDRDWHWWGKLNDDGLGAVVVLRGSAGDDARQINVPWTDPKRRYRVTACLSEKILGEFTGAQLQEKGVSLSLPPFGQEILELSVP